MANSELYDKQHKIPNDILKGINTSLINNPVGNGVKRAKFILKNGSLTYQAMKRLKNYFDYFNPQIDDKIQYVLAGGNAMKNFIDQTLNNERDDVKRSKNIKQDMSIDVNLGLKPYQTPKLNEDKKNDKTKNINDKKYDIDNYDNLKKNAIAVIANNDNNFLLLKRAEIKDGWGNNQWGLVGGGVKKNEEPDDACKREIKEETGLDIDIDKFIERVVIQRNPGSVEHIYACRYEGEPTDIVLNQEHTNYGWYNTNEMEFLNTVPNLIDYINLVFIKY